MIPAHHKAVARHIASQWDVRPRVETWSAEGTAVRQAVAVAEDHPQPGATTYSTIGLCDHGGHEITAVASSRRKSFVKAVFDVGSYAADGTREARPWAVFEKALGRYYTRSAARHLVLADAPLPGLKVAELATDPVTARWLYAVPLTSDELVYLETEGASAFRKLLESVALDTVLDLDRPTLPGVPHVDPWADEAVVDPD